MAIFETFSKHRKRLENAGKQDVYQYDHFPSEFRVQVIHIWRSAIGRGLDDRDYTTPALEIWKYIHDTLTREKGQFVLGGDAYASADQRCQSFLLDTDNSDDVLDIIELSFRVIDRVLRNRGYDYKTPSKVDQNPDEAIADLNQRFREHGIGYQYTDGILVRVDSQFVHDQVVKPALVLLHEAGFHGASDEFMTAFDKHRKGDTKGAIADALKAFESTMKAICDARKWARPSNATAKPLMDIVFNNGLIPKSLEGQFSALRSAMESGLPTISNQTSRHGQGAQPVHVPEHFAAYALHLAASNIVFLVECHKTLK